MGNPRRCDCKPRSSGEDVEGVQTRRLATPYFAKCLRRVTPNVASSDSLLLGRKNVHIFAKHCRRHRQSCKGLNGSPIRVSRTRDAPAKRAADRAMWPRKSRAQASTRQDISHVSAIVPSLFDMIASTNIAHGSSAVSRMKALFREGSANNAPHAPGLHATAKASSFSPIEPLDPRLLADDAHRRGSPTVGSYRCRPVATSSSPACRDSARSPREAFRARSSDPHSAELATDCPPSWSSYFDSELDKHRSAAPRRARERPTNGGDFSGCP